jgi:hypothetical protein
VYYFKGYSRVGVDLASYMLCIFLSHHLALIDALSNPWINFNDTTFSDGYLGSSIDEERSKV